MMHRADNTLFLFHLLTLLSLSACASTGTTDKPDHPTSVFKQVELADAAYAKGQWIEAEQHYQVVTQQAPNDYYAWFRLGNTRLRQSRLPSAIAAYESALQRDPEQAKPWYNLATAYLLQAQQALQQSWQRLPAGDPGRTLIAQKLEQLKQIVYTPVEDIPSPARGLIEQ
ncbi:MAG TPA: tetratricopeptide repeat protein [Chromatiaceae bacterium]|nr:tetratricopeptide repeat protein [Chromatiaceae bacterium]